MGRAGTVTGVIAEVKWFHYVAAGIHAWTITRPDGEWHLRAQIVLSDKFKMAQRPLTFVAPHQGGFWRWPIASFEMENGVLVARLGELEN